MLSRVLLLALAVLACASSVSAQSGWTQVNVITIGYTERMFHAAFTYNNAGTNTMVVVQGANSDLAYSPSSTLTSLASSTNGGATWSSFDVNTFKRLGHAAFSVVQGDGTNAFFVVGGLDFVNPTGVAANNVLKSTDLTSWTSVGAFTTGRYFHGAAVYAQGQKILVFGGQTKTAILKDTQLSTNGGATFVQQAANSDFVPSGADGLTAFAYTTFQDVNGVHTVIAGGATDLALTAYAYEVYTTNNDGASWTVSQNNPSLGRALPSMAYYPANSQLILAGGFTVSNGGRLPSDTTFIASTSNYVFAEETLTNTFQPRYGHAMVTLGSGATSQVYSLGGLTNAPGNDVVTSDVYKFGTANVVYTYSFVGYLSPCYSDNTYTHTCSADFNNRTGVQQPQFKCTGSDGSEELQPTNNGTFNANDMCNALAQPLPAVPVQTCNSLSYCFALYHNPAFSSSSGICNVAKYPNGCTPTYQVTEGNNTAAFFCQDLRDLSLEQEVSGGNLIVYPTQNIDPTTHVETFVINPTSKCAPLAIPAHIESNVPCSPLPYCYELVPTFNASDYCNVLKYPNGCTPTYGITEGNYTLEYICLDRRNMSFQQAPTGGNLLAWPVPFTEAPGNLAYRVEPNSGCAPLPIPNTFVDSMDKCDPLPYCYVLEKSTDASDKCNVLQYPNYCTPDWAAGSPSYTGFNTAKYVCRDLRNNSLQLDNSGAALLAWPVLYTQAPGNFAYQVEPNSGCAPIPAPTTNVASTTTCSPLNYCFELRASASASAYCDVATYPNACTPNFQSSPGFLTKNYDCLDKRTFTNEPATAWPIQVTAGNGVKSYSILSTSKCAVLSAPSSGFNSTTTCPTIDYCFEIAKTNTPSAYCSVSTFPRACNPTTTSAATRTRTQNYKCTDKRTMTFEQQSGSDLIYYPLQTSTSTAYGSYKSYITNSVSKCAPLGTPSGPDADVVGSTCTGAFAPSYCYSFYKNGVSSNYCDVNQFPAGCSSSVPFGQTSSSTFTSTYGCFDAQTGLLQANGTGVEYTAWPILSLGSGVTSYTINQATACKVLPAPNSNTLVATPCTVNSCGSTPTIYYASVGFGQCQADPVSGSTTPQYCYNNAVFATAPAAFQYAIYQCFQGGVAVKDSVCSNAGITPPTGANIDRVTCKLLPCIVGASYLPIGVGQCVSTENAATCCSRDTTTTTFKPNYYPTSQPLCSALAGKMQAPTLYQCTFNGEGYPGQCVDAYPAPNSVGYYQPCTLPFCGIQGDPEFIGFRGQRFEIHGVPGAIFNIISSPSVQYNAEFVFLGSKSERQCNATRTHPWTHPGTYLGTLGFKIGSERVLVVPGDCETGIKSVTVNGKELSVGEVHHFKGAHKQAISFSDEFTLHIALHELDITLENSDNFFNQQVSLTKAGQRTKAMHGLLGQTWSTKTYRDEAGHKHYIEGHPNDYLIQDDDIFGDDFMFNLYKL